METNNKLNTESCSTQFDMELMKAWNTTLNDSAKPKSDDFDKFLKILYDVVVELSNKN